MKKILFLLLLTVSSYGQTLQNPTFGTVTTKTNIESSTATKISVQETDGKINWLQPVNIPIAIPPHPINYSVTAPTLGAHLAGIDTKLGTIVATTAGVTTRVWFTADPTTITAGTFYTSNQFGKGTATSAIQNVVNNDNEKKYFTQDIIGVPFATATVFPAGVYASNLSVSTSPNSAAQRFTVEIYKCNNGGTPINSGVTGAPIGSLGVQVAIILDSGQINLVDGAVTNVQVSATLLNTLSVAVGERIRYHVSAEKIGTAGNNITESVYYGNLYNSYIDVPVTFNTSGITNVSTVVGATATDALNNLNTNKADKINRSDVALNSASNKRNDQSSMLRLNDGRLAIAYSRFGVSVGDIDPVSIYVKFSSDNGRTWTSESELIPTTSLGVMIPSMYKKTNGNILIDYFVREQSTPSNLSSIRQIEFNPTLTSIVTASSIIVPSGGYTPLAADRLYFDAISNRLLLPYPVLVSGAGGSSSSVYNVKILVSSNEGTSWSDSGLTINGFADISGFGGALEPGIFENKGKVTVYSRNTIGSVGACDLTWGGSSYSKSAEYKLNLKSMNSQSSIKYSSFLKGWIASVTRLYDQPTSTERRQLDMLFSKDLIDWSSLYTLEDITQTAGFMALEPNVFIDEKIYISYSYAPTSTAFDLKLMSFPFSSISNTETKTFKSFVTNPNSSNANEIANSDISLNTSFDSSIFANIVRSKITVRDNITVSTPASNSFHSNITYQNIINSSVGVKTINLGVISAFSPQQEIDNIRLSGQVSKIYIPSFTSTSLKNSSVIDKYSAIQIPRILDVSAGGIITTKYAINQEYSGDNSYFAGRIGIGNNTFYGLLSTGVGVTSPATFGGSIVAGSVGAVYMSGAEQLGGLELPGNVNYGTKIYHNNTTDSFTIATRASSTTWTNRVALSSLTGVLNVANLAGTGTRTVVADASGNLSATNAAGPKVYTAIISQSGTAAPTVTVLDNTLGGTVVWAYSSVGTYTFTLSGAFTSGKTIFFISNDNSFPTTVISRYATTGSVNSGTLFTYNGGTLVNGLLTNSTFEIRVYP